MSKTLPVMIGQLGENRHKMMANFIPKIFITAVGAVIDIWDVVLLDILVNLAAAHIQQGANNILGDSRNRSKCLNTAAS